MKNWEYKVKMWDEPMFDELKNMIQCGLVPTVKDEAIVFRIKGVAICHTQIGKMHLKVIVNTP